MLVMVLLLLLVRLMLLSCVVAAASATQFGDNILALSLSSLSLFVAIAAFTATDTAAAAPTDECKRAYAEGLLAWQLLTSAAGKPAEAYELARQGLHAAASFGLLPDHTDATNGNGNGNNKYGDGNGAATPAVAAAAADTETSSTLPVAAAVPVLATAESTSTPSTTAATATVSEATVASTSSSSSTSTSSHRLLNPAAFHAAKQRRRWSKAAKHLMTSSPSSTANDRNSNGKQQQEAPLQLLLRSLSSLNNTNKDGSSPPDYSSMLWQAWQLAPPLGEWPPPMRMAFALVVVALLLAVYGLLDLVLVAVSGEHVVECIARSGALLAAGASAPPLAPSP